MRKPNPSASVIFWIVAIFVSCAAPREEGQGGGSVDQFTESGDMVYGVTQVGNMVCFDLPQCLPTQVVYVVVTATGIPPASNTPAPMATRTPTQPTSTAIVMPTWTFAPTWTPHPATPTMVTPDGTYITPIANPEKCAVEPAAIRIYGWYRYTDAANLGIPQNIRVRPGTNYALVPSEKLAKNVTVTTYWLRWVGGIRWFAIEYPCGKWVSSGLGDFEYEQ